MSLWKHVSKGWAMLTNFVNHDIGTGDRVQFWGMSFLRIVIWKIFKLIKR